MIVDERLIKDIHIQKIDLITYSLPARVSGLYFEDITTKAITINSRLETKAERNSIVAEELGHSVIGGNLLFGGLDKVSKRKLENRGRAWGYNYMLPAKQLIRRLKAQTELWEIAEEFDVTVEFVQNAILCYQQKGLLPTYACAEMTSNF